MIDWLLQNPKPYKDLRKFLSFWLTYIFKINFELNIRFDFHINKAFRASDRIHFVRHLKCIGHTARHWRKSQMYSLRISLVMRLQGQQKYKWKCLFLGCSWSTRSACFNARSCASDTSLALAKLILSYRPPETTWSL